MGADYRSRPRHNLMGASGAIATGTTTFACPSTSPGVHLLEGRAETYFSKDCVLRNLRVHSHIAPGAGESFIFTVRVNGAPTLVVATIADLATEATDLVNAAAVTAGDYVTVQIVSSVAAANGAYMTWCLEEVT